MKLGCHVKEINYLKSLIPLFHIIAKNFASVETLLPYPNKLLLPHFPESFRDQIQTSFSLRCFVQVMITSPLPLSCGGDLVLNSD